MTPAQLIPRLASSSLIYLMLEVLGAEVDVRLSRLSDLFRRYDLTGPSAASTTEESSPSSLASIARALSPGVSSRIRASVTRALKLAWYSCSAPIARSWPRKACMTSFTSVGTCKDFADASLHQRSRSMESTAVSALTARCQSTSSSSSCLSDINAAWNFSGKSG